MRTYDSCEQSNQIPNVVFAQPLVRSLLHNCKWSFSSGVTEGCSASPVCEPSPCVASEWCRDIWRKFVCLPRLCTSRPCQNGGTCVEGVDDKGNSKFYCRCPLAFEGALCEVEGAVVVAEDSGVGFEDGLIIGRLHAAVVGNLLVLS